MIAYLDCSLCLLFQVLKQAVDEYKVGEIIPTLSFSVIYLKEDKHLNAKCSWVQKQLELIGAKFPSNVLTLDIRQPRFTTGKWYVLYVGHE